MDDQIIRAAIRRLDKLVEKVRDLAKALTTAIAAVNDKTQRFGTTVIGPLNGATDVTITWPKPFA